MQFREHKGMTRVISESRNARSVHGISLDSGIKFSAHNCCDFSGDCTVFTVLRWNPRTVAACSTINYKPGMHSNSIAWRCEYFFEQTVAMSGGTPPCLNLGYVRVGVKPMSSNFHHFLHPLSHRLRDLWDHASDINR